MADIVGVVASVITLSLIVLSGIKIARELYKAPKEIQTLEVEDNHESPNGAARF